MPTAIRQAIASTIAAYDAFVEARADADEFELVDGVIFMWANATETHEQIAGNIGAPLKLAMDRRGSQCYQGGIRVQRSDDKDEIDKTRPDVVVRCGPASKRTYITDPVVIVEVLSPSTIAPSPIESDRGAKLAFYKSLPTVEHIALVYQDQMRVEHYRRTDSGFDFEVLKTSTDQLTFAAVEFKLPLERVYFGVDI
jgi:Uma2 family endonuclease